MEDNIEKTLLNRYLETYSSQEIFRNYLYELDKPIRYKELVFYPIKMKFYIFFQFFSECLILRKDKVPIKEVIQMKYFDYLFYINEDKGINNLEYTVFLKELLYMSLKVPQDFITPSGEKISTIDYIYMNNRWYLRIYNETYDANDFETIRDILCEQNLVEKPDIKMHPKLEEKYIKYKKYMEKRKVNESGSIEDLILSLMAEMNLSREQVDELSIRTFYKLLERVGFIMDYKINCLLSPHLEKSTIDKLPYWTDKVKKQSKFEEMSTNLEDVKNKIK